MVFYQYGHLVDVNEKNFKGLVELATDISAFESEIILLEDSEGLRYLVLSEVQSLEKDGTLENENLTVVWSENVGNCIDQLRKGHIPVDVTG